MSALACMHTYRDTYRHRYSGAGERACARAHTHTHTHARTHTHTHTHNLLTLESRLGAMVLKSTPALKEKC